MKLKFRAPDFRPGGIRLGSAALTTRGFKEEDFETVGQLIHEGEMTESYIQVCEIS